MKLLEEIYFDPSHEASYSGVEKLANAVRGRVSRKEVVDWLKAQDAYNLHIPTRRKFQRGFYNITNIDDLWEIDLVDLKNLKDYNDGYLYILVVIDVLSKYAWVETLKNKSANEVKNAFERILERKSNSETDIQRLPLCVQSDKGKEFLGKEFQQLLSKHGIRFRTVRDPNTKAAVVERFNRTLKERMWRYFTHRNTHRYVDVLQQIVHAYNNSRHSVIKMRPSLVTLKNARTAYLNILQKYDKKVLHGKKKAKYSAGDYVRISRERGAFAKGYEAGWTEEIFVIKRVFNERQHSPVVYELKDLTGETIEGFFYERELSDVKKEISLQETEFIVERVIRSRGKGGKKQVLVKWMGYPDKFNSWIPESDLKNL